MNCLSNLVETRFLRNIRNEITLARNTLTSDPMHVDRPSFFPARLSDRKKLYNYYLKSYDLKAAFDDVDISDPNELLYYLQEGCVIWVVSKQKNVIDKVVLETAYTTGEMCIHRCKHIIQNKAVFAVMFDTRLTITPLTTN